MEPQVAPSPPAWGQVERHWLDDTSWVDIGRGWLTGDTADEAFGALRDGVAWKQNTIWRYDHSTGEPRLSAMVRPGPGAPHPAVTEMHKQLRRSYQVALDGVGLSFYRNGRDAMGAHRDSDMRYCEETVIAIVSLGATRPWTLRSTRATVPAFDIAPGHGDLLVMGGRAQADWLHGVPPAPGVREGRISLQWRWTSRRGRPETGGASWAPRNFGGGR
jgi:alkylated DNA repair dioxygenase AlkB